MHGWKKNLIKGVLLYMHVPACADPETNFQFWEGGGGWGINVIAGGEGGGGGLFSVSAIKIY